MLVGVGQYDNGNSFTDEIEIIDLSLISPKRCQNLVNFPFSISRVIGKLGSRNRPTICGGYNGSFAKDCYAYENNIWNETSPMESPRATAAVTYPNQSHNFFVSGGFDGQNEQNTGEIMNNDSWTFLKSLLPVAIRRHCMVLLNRTTVLLVGGLQQGIMSNRVFFFNSEFEKWIEGPPLKFARSVHSCAMIKTNGQSNKLSLVVAGGNNGTYMSSVEILDEGSLEWRAGTDLPQGTSNAMMVADSNNGVVLIGGMYSAGLLDKLYHLSDANSGWIEMSQKLKRGRALGTAFFVPDDITKCA